jgi:hypothetical protein
MLTSRFLIIITLLKRMHKVGDISTFPFSSTLPEHSRHENISDSHTLPNQVMMGSLRNKNKKKGFKQSMANPLPQKIIFTTNSTASGSSQQPPPPLPAQAQDISKDELSIPSGTIQPRLIPPSEIQELGQLPSNMFVTSVDVESDIWGDHHLPSQKKQGKKKQKTVNNEERYYDATFGWDIASDDDNAFTLTLPYFDTDIHTIGSETTAAIQAPSSGKTLEIPFDWDRLEKLWEECAVLEKLEQLVVGCLVGWKVCNPCLCVFIFFKI